MPRLGLKVLAASSSPWGMGNDGLQAARAIPFLQHLGKGLGDHLPGHLVDGGLSHRLVQAGLCHPSHALSAIHLNPLGNGTHPGKNQNAVGDIDIVSGVLPHGAAGKIFSHFQFFHRGGNLHPFGGEQSGFLRPLMKQQRPGRRLGRQGSTGAGGIAAAQLFGPFLAV